jgi:hypothetical protein
MRSCQPPLEFYHFSGEVASASFDDRRPPTTDGRRPKNDRRPLTADNRETTAPLDNRKLTLPCGNSMFGKSSASTQKQTARFCPEKRFSGTDSISGTSAEKAGGSVCLLDVMPV